MINQVTLVGRLTKDPELKFTPDGTPVTHVTLAVNRQYRNHNGEVDTDFVQCTLWRKTAENTVTYCRKGSVVGITGRIQTRHYDNPDRKRVYITEVVAETVRFLSSKPLSDKPQERSNIPHAETAPPPQREPRAETTPPPSPQPGIDFAPPPPSYKEEGLPLGM